MNLATRTWKRLGQMKRREAKMANKFITVSYIIDIWFIDANIKNGVIDAWDSVLTVRDNIDTTIVAGTNARKVIKHKKRLALAKVMYVLYKVFIYKAVIAQVLQEHDMWVRMLVDYMNMALDHVVNG